MPFDGAESLSRVIDTDAVKAIDEARRLLGPDGENWIKGMYSMRGAHCLVGAIRQACRNLDLRNGHNAYFYLQDVIGKPCEHGGIEKFNDAQQRTFGDIEKVLAAARDLAVHKAYCTATLDVLRRESEFVMRLVFDPL